MRCLCRRDCGGVARATSPGQRSAGRGAEARQRFSKSRERLIGRQVECAERARDDEAQRSRHSKTGRSIESGKERVEEMRGTRDGAIVSSHRSFDRNPAGCAQPNDVGRRNARQLAAPRAQHHVTHDGDGFSMVDRHAGSRKIGQ